MFPVNLENHDILISPLIQDSNQEEITALSYYYVDNVQCNYIKFKI